MHPPQRAKLGLWVYRARPVAPLAPQHARTPHSAAIACACILPVAACCTLHAARTPPQARAAAPSATHIFHATHSTLPPLRRCCGCRTRAHWPGEFSPFATALHTHSFGTQQRAHVLPAELLTECAVVALGRPGATPRSPRRFARPPQPRRSCKVCVNGMSNPQHPCVAGLCACAAC